MAGSRNSGRRASLGASAVVLLLVLNSLVPHPWSASERLLGNLRGPRSNAVCPLVRGMCSTTGSPKSPAADYVVRLSPRTQRNASQPSRSAMNSWPWRLSCEQWEIHRPHNVLRKLRSEDKPAHNSGCQGCALDSGGSRRPLRRCWTWRWSSSTGGEQSSYQLRCSGGSVSCPSRGIQRNHGR